ncbi:Putative transposase [Corynebacterium glyciniphilum AJ 3170]|uniref:Putative transposase n=1 Tax=Corynebacterium glyciniphilum AJ 3170 TaxID=1404245 RepID=X5E722_9CORY|nr:Putative transposase [Corynebacterium glyciniphilum AJ 3170]
MQRCLVHIQRVIRRHTTSRPRTPAGKNLYLRALKLTRIRDLDEAAAWATRRHGFGTVYHDHLTEKTASDPRTTPGGRN